MRNQFVRTFVVVVLFVSLTLGAAPIASAAPAGNPSSEQGWRAAIVRIVRVVRAAAKKTAGRVMANTDPDEADNIATPRP